MTAAKAIKAKPAKREKKDPARTRYADVLARGWAIEHTFSLLVIWIDVWAFAVGVLVFFLLALAGWVWGWPLLLVVGMLAVKIHFSHPLIRDDVEQSTRRLIRWRWQLKTLDDPKHPILERVAVGDALPWGEVWALIKRDRGRAYPVQDVTVFFRRHPDKLKAGTGKSSDADLNDFIVRLRAEMRFATTSHETDPRDPNLNGAKLSHSGPPSLVTGK